MNHKYLLIIVLCALNALISNAQDSSAAAKKKQALNLSEVTISSVRSVKGMGYLGEVSDGIVYSGQKTEVIITDSIDANTALSNPRQVMGRIPGAVFSETYGSGFPSNGVGFRGLNPVQSIETNTRMNGYNIAADIYGYPEAYFIPSLEAVQRVEVIRGASSLQFGPQFGGVVNYIIRDAPTKLFEFSTEETTGSFGMFNSFNTIGGTYKWFSYYGYFQYTHVNGWRPNSDYNQFSGFGKVQFTPVHNLKISLEYSALRNRIHMPGGLTDEEFEANDQASYRTRNWLESPWNIAALKLDWNIKPRVALHFTSAFQLSARELVWRNEDGGPQAMDTINPATGTYSNREVEREAFTSTTNELRLTANYNIGQTNNTLAAGVRVFYGKMLRQEDGEGTTGSNFDLTLLAPMYGTDMNFTTTNIAPFIENIFRVTDRFSITPGFRFEFLNSTAKGYTDEDLYDSTLNSNRSRNWYIPLAGIGLQYKTTGSTNIYANWSQAYSPVDYSRLTPFGSNAIINPNLKDGNGFNADLGFRGSIKNYLTFDLSGFYLLYNNKVGQIELTENGETSLYQTNIGNSRSVGTETYLEFNPVKMFTPVSKFGTVSFFNSFSYIDARYIDGLYQGNLVENAPHFIDRFGATYSIAGFSATVLVSHTSKCFTDAANSYFSEDAEIGVIPAYTVLDLSATYRFKNHFNIKAGINNLGNEHYFTLRTSEYPGPGIIPAIDRSFYIGLGATF